MAGLVGRVAGTGAGPGPAGPAPALLPLRDEITLHPGPRGADGSPSWTLEDPAAGRWYRIGWLEFEILARWSIGPPEAIAAAISRETPLRPSVAQVEGFARFLVLGNLVACRGDKGVARLCAQAAAGRPGYLMWLIKHYLFLRIPLVRPDPFLSATYPWLGWLFSRWFAALTVLAGALGLGLIARRWDEFRATFLHFFSWEGAALMALALFGAKLAHELGHAYSARRHGCSVPTMGVALLVLWPVLYTDTSGAWKLTGRGQRLAIGAAGIRAELTIAAFAALAWSLLPDGPGRSVAFLLATSTWVLTLVVNLNPFMRFDGYYLLADALDVANLQERSFALARWRLREALFGFGDPPPERPAPRLERILVLYAFGTWLYRFFLFLGIAFLVYYLFFKLLGILLFLVEIWWFIMRPIVRELGWWLKRRRHARPGRAALVMVGLPLVLAGVLLFPWQQTVHLPAVLRAERQVALFVDTPAQLVEAQVQAGTRVHAGQLLFRFEQPDLTYDLSQAERRAALAAWQVDYQSVSRELADRSRVLWQELESARVEAARLRSELARLEIRAPFDGVMVDPLEPLALGEWLPKGTVLALLVDDRTAVVEAYLAESEIERLGPQARGRFYPDDLAQAPVPLQVVSIDGANSRVLNQPLLASSHGGRIAVRQDERGNAIPESPIYRVILAGRTAAPAAVLVGQAVLEAGHDNLARRLWAGLVATLIRESGF